MLSIILKILSVLGIILLVLLGIILTVLLLVLFFPICYRVKADRQPVTLKSGSGQEALQEPEWAVHADVRAWWLFGLLRAVYQYPEPGELKVKALFFTLYNSAADKATDTEETTKGEEEQLQSPKQEQSESSSDNTDNSAKDKEAETSSTQTTSAQTSSTLEENLTLIEKIQYTIQRICDKIKDIRENIEYYKEVLSDEETKGLLKHASLRLGKILKSIRPRKFRADIRFGAASPDTTGYVCAVYGMICYHLGKDVSFTPDFEQEIFEGNIYAAGHTNVFQILWNVLMVVKDKRLWKLKDKLANQPD